MKPVLQALVIADHVYQDKRTNKAVIAGTFNQFMFMKKKPPVPPGEGMRTVPLSQAVSAGSPYAYLSLREIVGKTELELRFVDLRDERVLFFTKFEVNSADRLQTVEVVLPLPALPIDHEGTYALELMMGEESLGSHRIIAREMKPPESDPPPAGDGAGPGGNGG